MSVLEASQILCRLNEQDLKKRLVVSPLLDLNDQLREGQSSIDVRLGFEFALIAPSSFSAIDEFASDFNSNFSKLYRKEYVPFGASLTIHPHQLILGTTLEYIRLPQDLMSYVVGRSTWGRLGLINATAIGIHPGFAGSLTLELRNLGETPLLLYPGQTIGQLFFHHVYISNSSTQLMSEDKSAGQYGGSVDMLPRSISSALTREKLAKLKKKYMESRS